MFFPQIVITKPDIYIYLVKYFLDKKKIVVVATNWMFDVDSCSRCAQSLDFSRMRICIYSIQVG